MVCVWGETFSGWSRGLHGDLHGEVDEGEEGNRANSRQTAALGWSRDHVTATVDILHLWARVVVLCIWQ